MIEAIFLNSGVLDSLGNTTEVVELRDPCCAVAALNPKIRMPEVGAQSKVPSTYLDPKSM